MYDGDPPGEEKKDDGDEAAIANLNGVEDETKEKEKPVENVAELGENGNDVAEVVETKTKDGSS